MKAVRFTLTGKNAFFKKPEVNAYCYFTYGQIHKVALLGIFGAILGYGGYNQKIWAHREKGDSLTDPEFYERLNNLKISVVPQNDRGYIPKKIQVFNNSVGYASEEQGGNLIVKEQWLENPKWDIYILIDCEEAEKILQALEERRYVYIPYLGKNDHLADINDVEFIDLEKAVLNETEIHSLFPRHIGEICLPDDEDEIEEYKYEEKLPSALNKYTNLYEYDTFCYTNLPVNVSNYELYIADNRVLAFY